MRKISLIIFGLGLIVSWFFGSDLYVSMTGDGLGGGFGVIIFGWPLILIGIILFVIDIFKRRRNR